MFYELQKVFNVIWGKLSVLKWYFKDNRRFRTQWVIKFPPKPHCQAVYLEYGPRHTEFTLWCVSVGLWWVDHKEMPSSINKGWHNGLSWKPTSERTATPQQSVNTENWLQAQKSSGALSKPCGTRMPPTPGSHLLWSTEKRPGGQRCLPPRLGRRAPPWAVGHWTSSWKRWKGRGLGWGTPACGTDPPGHAVSRTEPRWGAPRSRRSCAGQHLLTPAGRGSRCWVPSSAGHRPARGLAGWGLRAPSAPTSPSKEDGKVIGVSP